MITTEVILLNNFNKTNRVSFLKNTYYVYPTDYPL